jgi:hypothetical protein
MPTLGVMHNSGGGTAGTGRETRSRNLRTEVPIACRSSRTLSAIGAQAETLDPAIGAGSHV